jgi:hypothetical protein
MVLDFSQPVVQHQQQVRSTGHLAKNIHAPAFHNWCKPVQTNTNGRELFPAAGIDNQHLGSFIRNSN